MPETQLEVGRKLLPPAKAVGAGLVVLRDLGIGHCVAASGLAPRYPVDRIAFAHARDQPVCRRDAFGGHLNGEGDREFHEQRDGRHQPDGRGRSGQVRRVVEGRSLADGCIVDRFARGPCGGGESPENEIEPVLAGKQLELVAHLVGDAAQLFVVHPGFARDEIEITLAGPEDQGQVGIDLDAELVRPFGLDEDERRGVDMGGRAMRQQAGEQDEEKPAGNPAHGHVHPSSRLGLRRSYWTTLPVSPVWRSTRPSGLPG